MDSRLKTWQVESVINNTVNWHEVKSFFAIAQVMLSLLFHLGVCSVFVDLWLFWHW